MSEKDYTDDTMTLLSDLPPIAQETIRGLIRQIEALEAERDELRTRLENKDKFRKRAIEQRDNFEAQLKEAQATIDKFKSRLISAEQSNGEFSKRNKKLMDVVEKAFDRISGALEYKTNYPMNPRLSVIADAAIETIEFTIKESKEALKELE
jgi:chromosome segregation ATPase